MDKLNILIVIDMQNDFTYGSLANPAAVATIPKIEEKIKKYLDNPDGRIIFTRDTHHEDIYLNSEEGKHLPIKHCIHNTHGWKLVEPFEKILEDYSNNNEYSNHGYLWKINVINKNTFGSSYLCSMLDDIDYVKDITVELVGTCTSLCVLANAFIAKSAISEFGHVIIDAECCSDVTKEMHNKALAVMQNAHMEVINWESNVDKILNEL